MKNAEEPTLLMKMWERKKRELKLTQYDAADRLGIKQPTFNQYLHGKAAMNDRTAFKAAQLFNCKPEELKPDYSPPSELLMIPDDPTPADFVPQLSEREIVQLANGQIELSELRRTINPELHGRRSRDVFVMEIRNNSVFPLLTMGSKVAIETDVPITTNNYQLIVLNGSPIIALFNGIVFELANGNSLDVGINDVQLVGQALHALRKPLSPRQA